MKTPKPTPRTPKRRVIVELLGDDDQLQDVFEIGETVALRGTGFKPAVAYDIDVDLKSRAVFSSRLITDADGSVEPTVLWAQLGLDDPWSAVRYTVDEARERFAGHKLGIRVRRNGRSVARVDARISPEATRPLVLVADREGRPVNGLEPDERPLFVLLAGLWFDGPVRVLLVQQQHDWRVGDALLPATLTDGRPAIVEAQVERGGATLAELPDARLLAPGAYDIIVRPLRYGFEDNETLVLTSRDVIGSRRITGLVIRESFWTAKPVLGGCVNKIALSGRSLPGAPYFRYSDTFEIGANVYAALDPGIVDPGNVGKMCAFYVVANRTATQWSVDNSLTHLGVLGGNSAVIKVKLQPGCINANKVLVWPTTTQLGEYDIVADFGNNSVDASTFASDAAYDTPLDIIDGYFVAGFRVVADPGTLTEWPNVGSWDYTETTQGSVTVQDENRDYSTPGGFSTANTLVPRRANVRFPTDAPGITDPSQISAAKANYPLVVVVHGNGHSYTSYNFLLEHLARNGFIAASVHLNGDMKGLGRANVFFQHLPVLQAAFGAKLQNHIGVMGHSRGGEAVLKIARLNQQGSLGHGIDCLISLAPTDQYGHEVLGPPWATPFFVLYGSRDGDIDGGIWTQGYTVPQTGFALYDRASGSPKHMVFVHRASHNGFITTNENFTGEASFCIDPTDQRKITLAYMNAFFRTYLLADGRWEGMFTGEWQPPSVSTTGVNLFVQTRQPGQQAVDDFETVPSWSSSSIGGSVVQTGLPANPSEGRLRHDPAAPGIDPKSPHDSKGQRLRWAGMGRLEWSIPAGQRDVSSFAAIAVRAGQTADSASNPVNQAQNLRVALRDGTGNERAVRVGAFTVLPYPDVRLDNSVTKSALRTVRIPLTSYTIVCAGQPMVDLTDVVGVALTFGETPTGEIDIDELEFTT
jgi:hypothetical protein